MRRCHLAAQSVGAGFKVELVECNGGNNHVHILVSFPPKIALSKRVIA
ncbi:transposase [Streptomyces sp. NPDC054861]